MRRELALLPYWAYRLGTGYRINHCHHSIVIEYIEHHRELPGEIWDEDFWMFLSIINN